MEPGQKGISLKLGTKLTVYLSLVIVLVLSVYGYVDTLSRRDLLVRKTKAEVRSTGRTLRASLEKTSLPQEQEYVQGLVDAVSEYERTFGVIVYYGRENLLFRSRSLKGDIEPYLDSIKNSMRDNLVREEFGTYKKVPIFLYAFPLKDKNGNSIGGVAILQHTSYMESEIRNAMWSIVIATLVLIGATVALILVGTRRWVSQPVSKLMAGIRNMSKGDLSTRIELKGKSELSELAHSFNQMAGDLKKAQERIVREAEARLELESGLRQSEKLATVGQLASGLAHEIGTPLNILLGRTELIKRKLDDRESLQRNVEIMESQIERITKIIQQLLGFVRKKKPEQQALDISLVLETALDLLDHRVEKQKLTVERDFERGLPPVIGDPDALQQVFLNLILNAIQSMPEGGRIRVSALATCLPRRGFQEGERQYIEVCVKDTGAGMEEEVIRNIFSPFFTTKETGTGLGLMVTQGIVQDHDGWIEVKSELGKGSIFKVYLPVFERSDET